MTGVADHVERRAAQEDRTRDADALQQLRHERAAVLDREHGAARQRRVDRALHLDAGEQGSPDRDGSVAAEHLEPLLGSSHPRRPIDRGSGRGRAEPRRETQPLRIKRAGADPFEEPHRSVLGRAGGAVATFEAAESSVGHAERS